MLRQLFIITLLFFITQHTNPVLASGETKPDGLSFRQSIEMGFNAIYNGDYDRAFKVAQDLKATHKNNPQTYLLEANYWWWKILSGEDTDANYEKMEACLDMALSKIPKRKTKDYSNEELYNAINVYAYKSRIKIFQGKYIKGAQNLNTCIDYVEASFGKEDNYELFKLTSGLYYYFIDYGYENYVLARAYLIFLPDGDKQKGLAFLKNAYQSNNLLVKTEAAYFLMKTYCELEKNYAEALKYCTTLIELHPNNLLYRYHQHRILLFEGKKDLATRHLNLLLEAQKKGKTHAEHFVSLAQEDAKTIPQQK